MRVTENNENNYSNVLPSVSSCFNDHLQGHQVVINDAVKEFSTVLHVMSTGAWRCGQNGSRTRNWQILTTQNSALQCSYEQETENASNLEVLDDLNYAGSTLSNSSPSRRG